MNKCLARSNKSRTGEMLRTGSVAQFPGRLRVGKTRCGGGRHCLSPPFGGARRVEAEHELAKSRPVFVPRPACRFRGVTGYHLRIHSEISQAETAGSRAETLDRDREGGRSAIAAEARRSAIALRSALREHQGPPAKGASTPHGSTFRSIRRNEAPGGPRSKWQRPF